MARVNNMEAGGREATSPTAAAGSMAMEDLTVLDEASGTTRGRMAASLTTAEDTGVGTRGRTVRSRMTAATKE